MLTFISWEGKFVPDLNCFKRSSIFLVVVYEWPGNGPSVHLPACARRQSRMMRISSCERKQSLRKSCYLCVGSVMLCLRWGKEPAVGSALTGPYQLTHSYRVIPDGNDNLWKLLLVKVTEQVLRIRGKSEWERKETDCLFRCLLVLPGPELQSNRQRGVCVSTSSQWLWQTLTPAAIISNKWPPVIHKDLMTTTTWAASQQSCPVASQSHRVILTLTLSIRDPRAWSQRRAEEGK